MQHYPTLALYVLPDEIRDKLEKNSCAKSYKLKYLWFIENNIFSLCNNGINFHKYQIIFAAELSFTPYWVICVLKNPIFAVTKFVPQDYHMPNMVWDEINYPFPNFNGCTVEVWERISNLIPHAYCGCNYLSMLGVKWNHISKRGPWNINGRYFVGISTSWHDYTDSWSFVWKIYRSKNARFTKLKLFLHYIEWAVE